ncbi:uncharacterized protein TNCV_3407281 [Trichonephila clavipes]|nr:uncharacterized protein TNCV_3407281 [Trichonephila clavipes]
MPRLQKVFKKRKGKYYPRKNTINSKVSTTDCKLNAQAEHAHDSKQSCAKEKKIHDLNESFSSFGDSVCILNAIMNLNILAFVFKNEVHCKMCNSGLDMQVLKGKSGLAITFVLKCFACPYSVEFSSNFHEGTQIATINTRFVYAMRSIGKGAEAGRMFCGVMNLPQPPTRFAPYGKRILNAAKLVYEDSIQNAAKEAICENEGNKNIAVAVDGTWQKRGYTSLNGVVTVTSIDTGKVIDVDILSKYCACKNLPFHEKDCKRNYVGSSGAMEIQGASKSFQRSLSLHNARYITYLGDGDCKAFDAVKKKNIYGNEYPIEKLECIGHVIKRMGTRLRRLKAQLKGQILSDGKCLSGKNRLTEHKIDNLQSYYGSAIRRNHSSVQNMRQAIWAIFCISSQLMNILNMVFVPSGKIHGVDLKRLTHQIETLSLGVYDAVCSFNDGNVSRLKMLQKMGVEPGEFSVSAMKLLDRERLMKAIYAFSGRSKKIRKDKRRKRKKEEDNIKKNKALYRLPLITALWDTGAEKSFISEEVYLKYFSYRPRQKTKDRVVTAQEATCCHLGRVELQIRIREFQKTWEFHILNKMQYQCILGIDFMKESKLTLDFDQKSLTIHDNQIKQLQKIESGLFSDQTEITHILYHEIDTGDKGPVVSRPYRYDRVKQGIIDYHIEKMLQEDTIRLIQSPYSSPVVLTRKNNGLPPDSPEEYRFEIDYRKLNAITKYP